MTVCYTWFHERFQVLPADASEETVRIYARAYILLLLSSQLFANKNANWVNLCWLPYLASMDDLGRYSWGSAALAWLLRPSGFDVFGFPLASRLRVRDFVWEPYSSPDVTAVVHPEILVDEHCRLWTAATSLIYFAAIEWHQVDRVVPQFGGVQHLPQLALKIDWIHAKDGRADPGPLAKYLDWWCRVAHRFLSPNVAFHDPRLIVLTEEARHRGSSQAPPKVQVPDRPDNRRVDRHRRIGTRATDREWRWLDDLMDEDLGGADDGGVMDHRLPRRRARRQGERDGRGQARGRGPPAGDDGAQHAIGEDVGSVDTGMDQPTYKVRGSSQKFGSVDLQGFADFTTAAVGMDIEDPVSQSEFFRDRANVLRDDDATHYRPQMPEVHSQFAEYQPPSQDV
ncbi:hypothetical protein Ahy_A03g014259 [Arachis hypogaea]|uniref:Aminotransferase-like plant mobile domain-containing protein n=1 Tax=Arachis hypogaea TaxID=3818 RepID=A0A445DX98_ARAHY|nr:hypothetical protein Ahy_A03g014259 [Arachis hypogaea]